MEDTFKAGAEGDFPARSRECKQPHMAGPQSGSFWISLQNTDESGFLAPEIREK